MKNHLSYLQKIFIFFFFCSISFPIFISGQNFYVPNHANLVALNQQNDFHISVAINPFFQTKKLSNLQVGYSPIKHLGIASSYFTSNHLNKDFNILTENKTWDIAIGGYLFHSTRASKNSTNKTQKKHQHLFIESGLLFDLYLIHGSEKLRNIAKELNNYYFKVQKNYIQLGAHAKFKFMELHAVTRIGNIRFNNLIVQGQINSSLMNAIDNLNNNNNFMLIENSFRANFGVKYGQLIISFSRVLNSDRLHQLGIINNVSSIGMNIDIDEFFRRD